MAEQSPLNAGPAGGAADGALQESLRDVGIPPRPAILDVIAGEMHRPEPDFRRLGTIICADVGLAAGLLKTANSPFFGFRTRARTVNQALVMLGLDITCRAIAGIILRNLFLASPALERFWDASARIAQASGWLVGKVGIMDGIHPEDAYTYGLFRDCGIAVLLRKFPQYEATLQAANGEGEAAFTAVEEARCPTNHALVGYLLCQSWGLPEEITLAVRGHHDVTALRAGTGSLPPASGRLIALAQLSEHFVQQLTGLSKTREWEKLGPACLDVLGLDGGDLERLLAEAPAAVGEVV